MHLLKLTHNPILCALLICALAFITNEAVAQSDTPADTPDMLVSSRGTHSIKQYDGDTGDYMQDFVAARAGGLEQPEDVVFGPDGHLYVTGFQNAQIKKYDGQDGSYLGNFSSNYTLVNPTKMTFHSDSLIYVSQWGGNEKVIRFDMFTGEFVDEYTSTRIVNGCGHAWDEDGNLFVASWGSDGTDGSVHKFDPEGNFEEIFIQAGVGGLAGPVNVWFRDGDLFVGDWSIGRVLRYDGQTGDFKGNFITGLTRLEGYFFGDNDDIFLADWQSNRINRYDSTGQFLEIFATGGGLVNPNSVTFRPADVATANEEIAALPEARMVLHPSFPNPFIGQTTIPYELTQPGTTAISIYSTRGKLVKTFNLGHLELGKHTLIWDGRDQAGKPVASGSYHYVINSGSLVKAGTLVRIR